MPHFLWESNRSHACASCLLSSRCGFEILGRSEFALEIRLAPDVGYCDSVGNPSRNILGQAARLTDWQNLS
jgi:hypothetical protein